MNKLIGLIFLMGLLLLDVSVAFATHNRAGEITYRQIGQNEIELTVTMYATNNNNTDQTEVTIDWGDGTSSDIPRTIYQLVNAGIRKKVYVGKHTYPGPNPVPGQPYLASMEYPNRIDKILNIDGGSSSNISFFLQTEIYLFPPSIFGFNSSPILLEPPIDFGVVGQVFQHTPNGFDPDGDSVAYEMATPLQALNQVVPNYQLVSDIQPGLNNQFTFDELTGLFTWDAPQKEGIYNIAILVKSYRNGIYLGAILRDIQIDIGVYNNTPPEVDVVEEICVVAGEAINLPVSVVDRDVPQQNISTTATGGVFSLQSSPASFTIQSPAKTSVANPLVGQFSWQTNCSHVQDEPYQIVFKAKDDVKVGTKDYSLATFKVLKIKVIAPAPQNVGAVLTLNDATISWDAPYICSTAPGFLGFTVWRKEGCDDFLVDSCAIGLRGKGYTKISASFIRTPIGATYQYKDNTIQKGVTYSYRILAEFATPIYYLGNITNFHSPVSSLPSEEVCIATKEDLPRFINVDVKKTAVATGEIFVRWIKPNIEELDTLLYRPPYRYEVYQSIGQDGSSFSGTPVFTSPQYTAFYLANDTFFTDTNLNTLENGYSYQMYFYAGGDTVGQTKIASSVYLNIAASDAQNTLTWTENIPWVNSEYRVYELVNNTKVLLGLVTSPSYTHKNLVNGETYCYVIEALGAYNMRGTPDTLFNFSQEACGTPLDTIAPCPPTGILGITSCSANIDDSNKPDRLPCQGNILPMDELYNEIKWNAVEDDCGSDIATFKVYFSPYCSEPYVLVYESDDRTDTSFIHKPGVGNLSGCYYISSVDSLEVNGGGNESDSSQVIVTDNCPFYDLPNTFTPNGDGQNDLFGPCLNLRFIKEVNFKVTNRWGQVVFTTTDPAINWDGKDSNTGADLAEGVYFYTCQIIQDCITCLPLEPKIGAIHLIRGR